MVKRKVVKDEIEGKTINSIVHIAEKGETLDDIIRSNPCFLDPMRDDNNYSVTQIKEYKGKTAIYTYDYRDAYRKRIKFSLSKAL